MHHALLPRSYCVELHSNSNPACLWVIQIASPPKIWLWGVLLLGHSSTQPTAIEIQVGIHPMVSSPLHPSWFASQSTTPPNLPPMNATSIKLPIQRDGPVAHPLYPVEQVFLWLPGLPGAERPYCTYNAALESPNLSEFRVYEPADHHDENGALHSPQYPINPGTYICWHLHTSPPIPFHGVPITHSLSTQEMSELAQRVLISTGEDPSLHPDPRALLRNDRKCFILASLSRMGVLSGSVLHPG